MSKQPTHYTSIAIGSLLTAAAFILAMGAIIVFHLAPSLSIEQAHEALFALTGLIGILVSSATALLIAKMNATQHRVEVAQQKIEEVHVLVNSRLSVALASIAVLKRQLGIPILPEEVQAEEDVLKQAAALEAAAKIIETARIARVKLAANS